MTIGNRAYKEIKKRAKENGTSPSREAAKLGMDSKQLTNWKKHNINPSGYYLQQMCLAGYDVIYILTGEREHEE